MIEINPKLKKYLEDSIFPIYQNNDSGHNMEHINYVIKRSLMFASQISDINYDMVYTIASYHDICHHIDAKNHEKLSSEYLLNDTNLREFFTDDQIKVMSEAVFDHRASLEYEPRSIYGKIVSSADRNVEIEMPFRRTYTYRVVNSLESTLEEILNESREHIIKKFGSKGYATEKMYFEDLDYKKFLEDISRIASDDNSFRKMYYEVNGISDTEKNMIFLFDEISKSKNDLSLDQILYYVYIKLDTDKSFDEIKEDILRIKGISRINKLVKKN